MIDDDRKLLQVYEELLTGREVAITTCAESSQALIIEAQKKLAGLPGFGTNGS